MQTNANFNRYNFAVDKMHTILSKYPVKNEAYLMNASLPDVQEYLAWKKVSALAIVHKYTLNQALDAFQAGLHKEHEQVALARESGFVSPTWTEATTTYLHSDSSDIDAARILSSMSFESVLGNGTLFVDEPYQESPTIASPTFPRPEDLPVPAGEDAFLLNPVLEDAQRRWIKGVFKQDLSKEVVKRNAEGNRVWVKKTIYIVDGKQFYDVEPRKEAKHVLPKLSTSFSGIDTAAILSEPRESRQRMRPLDSGIALASAYEKPEDTSRKRKRSLSASSDDVPLSSLSRPGHGFGGRSPSSSAGEAEDEVDLLPSRNLPQTPKRLIHTFKYRNRSNPKGVSLALAAPSSDEPQAPTTSDGSRRKARPAPLNLVPRIRPKGPHHRSNLPSSPSPMKSARHGGKEPPTPQHSSPAGTPRKNKYVPTTPNPMRWSAAELYHLNTLARRGLHPKELHPMMQEQFPDKVRSVHAIKDRRDKMARAKELIGKVPDYQSKYGTV